MSVSDIMIGGARIFYAPEGEALPDETDVAYGAAWGGNWVEIGLTSTPVTWAHNFTETDINVEQRLAAVARARTSEALMLETVLAELTADNLNLAMNGTVSPTSAGASQDGFEDLDAGGEAVLTVRAWGFEGRYVEANGTKQPVRLFLYLGTATLNGNLVIAKETPAGISFQVKGLADTSKAVGADLFKFQRVTAEKTS